MFSGCPWGGYGANPTPNAMQSDWNTHGSLISGGMPYSEGIYLDMNQVMRQQQYWAGRPTNETLADYVRFEFGWDAEPNVTQAVNILEANIGWLPGDFPKGRDPTKNASSQHALELLTGALPRMTEAAQKSWRWRVLYLRATIDALSFRGKAANLAALNASFAELAAIYHTESDCCHKNSPEDCTDAIDTQANCTLKVLRPGFSGSSAAECSDARLKTDIVPLGASASGVPLFSWRYLAGHGLDTGRRYVGTTAQALLSMGRHDAVVNGGCGGGYYAVDYSRLDVKHGALKHDDDGAGRFESGTAVPNCGAVLEFAVPSSCSSETWRWRIESSYNSDGPTIHWIQFGDASGWVRDNNWNVSAASHPNGPAGNLLNVGSNTTFWNADEPGRPAHGAPWVATLKSPTAVTPTRLRYSLYVAANAPKAFELQCLKGPAWMSVVNVTDAGRKPCSCAAPPVNGCMGSGSA